MKDSSDSSVSHACSYRALCEANHAAVGHGAAVRGDAAEGHHVAADAAEVGSYILMSQLPISAGSAVLHELRWVARVGRLRYGEIIDDCKKRTNYFYNSNILIFAYPASENDDIATVESYVLVI